MSEKEIKFGFKIGFADWQFYPLFLSAYLLALFFGVGVEEFGAFTYVLVGVCMGATYFRFVESYFDWSTAKLGQLKPECYRGRD